MDIPEHQHEKSMFEYAWIAGKVFKDKAWYTLWNFDMFERVNRCYPKESYYNSFYTLITNDANHVIDNIYLGSAFNAADHQWLTDNKIKVIINVTPSISNYYENEYEYYNYNTPDLSSGSLESFYEPFYNLMEKYQDDHVLVHCFAGKSRSAALVLYYLMKKYDWSYNEAMDYLKSKRPGININVVFVDEVTSLIARQRPLPDDSDSDSEVLMI